ncbi:L(+)-tartrate dehydratase subunit beta [bacterium BMS3Bbin06]|nr:L(+)-tartrate dehydratase subunit beta [bacterium BMS3Abin08]GBE34301.1 L(+)-tartrate dehydratase subunit beta [bacterium BMS3Bbin06]HDO34749.1 fumarate hydrolyase [Nitrospirota bacterium]HDY71044.1 fumarate hydrolyase [Nitrospirota bacterium]
MTYHTLNTPFDEKTMRSLHVGDMVTINGHIFGMRDKTMIQIFDKGDEPPVDLNGFPVLHTAPSLKRVGNKWEKICIGTTTSTRMDRFSPPLIEKYGVRAFIGKGGLYEGSLEAMQRYGACYFAIVGGAAALETTQVEEVEHVYWPELHPEAIYKLRVKDFGPLVVAMDSHGESLYSEVKANAQKRLPEIYQKLGIKDI